MAYPTLWVCALSLCLAVTVSQLTALFVAMMRLVYSLYFPFSQGYEIKEKQDEDVLFVQKGKTDLVEKNKIMFPLLSHA